MPTMNLAMAKRIPLLGDSSRWDGFGGQRLDKVPDKVLHAAARWFREKLRESESPRMEVQLEAIRLVLADREANSPQTTLAL